jgi:hypothetical protein
MMLAETGGTRIANLPSWLALFASQLLRLLTAHGNNDAREVWPIRSFNNVMAGLEPAMTCSPNYRRVGKSTRRRPVTLFA